MYITCLALYFLNQGWDIIKQGMVPLKEEKPFQESLKDGPLPKIHKRWEDWWEIGF